MKGKELKIIVDKWLGKTNTPVLEFIVKSGIEQRTYYRLFERKNDVPEHYIDSLVMAGLDLTVIDNNKNISQSFKQNDSIPSESTTNLKSLENEKSIYNLSAAIVELSTVMSGLYKENKELKDTICRMKTTTTQQTQ